MFEALPINKGRATSASGVVRRSSLSSNSYQVAEGGIGFAFTLEMSGSSWARNSTNQPIAGVNPREYTHSEQ